MPPKKKKGDEPERMPLLGRATNNVGIGIVGLLIPNVGKSTFFNTLSKLHVPAENYPFCTWYSTKEEPNLAKVPVPDQV